MNIDKLIEQFERDTEHPAYFVIDGKKRYTQGFVEWLADRVPVWISVGDVARFFMKVQDKGYCWEWTGSTNKDGYGTFRLGKKIILAHRYSFMVANNKQPNDCILHRCDNPLCVNPHHLYDGSHKDNMHDIRKSGYRRQNVSSQYIGVSWRNDSKKWRAMFKGKSLGSFELEVDAAAAYDEKALEYYGEKADLNFSRMPLPSKETL